MVPRDGHCSGSDLPDETYETLRRRARAAGRSIQSYMRDRLVEMAATPSKDEALAAIDAALAHYGGAGASGASIADDVTAVAGYRHRWAVTGPLPLGDAATDIDQANERALLAIAINHTIGEASVAPEDPWGTDRLDRARHARLQALDTLGW